MNEMLFEPDSLKEMTIPVSFLTYKGWTKGINFPMRPFISEVFKKNGSYYLTGKFRTIDDAEKAAYYLKCGEQPFCYDFDLSPYSKTTKRNRLLLQPFRNYEFLETWCDYHPDAEIKLEKLTANSKPADYMYVDLETFQKIKTKSNDYPVKDNPKFNDALIIEGNFSLDDLQEIAATINGTDVGSMHKIVSKQCGYLPKI